MSPRAMSMPGRILSYLGSTLLTGGGALFAQGEAAQNTAAVNTGIGVIVMGLATFFAPHVTQWLKDWRDERKKGYQRQINDLRGDLGDVQSKLNLTSHLLGVALTVIHDNRGRILESYRTGKPIEALPEGFMQREFDNLPSTIEALMATQPSRSVMEVLDRKKALPTPDPAARRRHKDRPAGATDLDMPTISGTFGTPIPAAEDRLRDARADAGAE